MTWIRVIDEDEAEGILRDFYASLRRRFGFVPNITKAASLRPAALMAASEWGERVTWGSSGLGRRMEEMIAVVVSAANRCHY
ncbi:MAG: carboxymuconolactone decarboxylase family protein [Acidobacteria bacterium]|nr:carboxymuconolactone decarboxylase family protein [Acidobacteriota bacterium]